MLAAAALAAQDYPAAGKWLDMIVTDPDSPPTLRQTAELLLGIVGSGKPASK